MCFVARSNALWDSEKTTTWISVVEMIILGFGAEKLFVWGETFISVCSTSTHLITGRGGRRLTRPSTPPGLWAQSLLLYKPWQAAHECHKRLLMRYGFSMAGPRKVIASLKLVSLSSRAPLTKWSWPLSSKIKTYKTLIIWQLNGAFTSSQPGRWLPPSPSHWPSSTVP